MSVSSNSDWTAARLAPRWAYKSPSSVLRVMKRFGVTGKKFGDAKQAARRFSADEVALVERLAGIPLQGAATPTVQASQIRGAAKDEPQNVDVTSAPEQAHAPFVLIKKDNGT